jgi:hypothetical protein
MTVAKPCSNPSHHRGGRQVRVNAREYAYGLIGAAGDFGVVMLAVLMGSPNRHSVRLG